MNNKVPIFIKYDHIFLCYIIVKLCNADFVTFTMVKIITLLFTLTSLDIITLLVLQRILIEQFLLPKNTGAGDRSVYG